MSGVNNVNFVWLFIKSLLKVHKNRYKKTKAEKQEVLLATVVWFDFLFRNKIRILVPGYFMIYNWKKKKSFFPQCVLLIKMIRKGDICLYSLVFFQYPL